MASQVKYLTSIPTAANRKSILLRMGYNPHLTVLNELHQRSLDEGISQGAALCNLAGAYVRKPIIEHNQARVRLENDQCFESAKLAKLLSNSGEVLLMGTTVGSQIVDQIHQAIIGGNATQGVILDAVASETADAGLDWMMQLLNNMLAKEGKKLTKHRYSPGYGDLALSHQKIIFELLGLAKLNLTLTPEYLLIPEKSVLAVAGIELL